MSSSPVLPRLEQNFSTVERKVLTFVVGRQYRTFNAMPHRDGKMLVRFVMYCDACSRSANVFLMYVYNDF